MQRDKTKLTILTQYAILMPPLSAMFSLNVSLPSIYERVKKMMNVVVKIMMIMMMMSGMILRKTMMMTMVVVATIVTILVSFIQRNTQELAR